MLKKLCATVFLLLFSNASHASCEGTNVMGGFSAEDSARLARLVAAHPFPEGNLWRADRPGSTVIVAGTVHLPDPRLDPMVERVAPYVQGADLLIVEADAATEAAMTQMMVERPESMFITEGPTLIDLLGEEDWARLSEDLKERGVPAFMAAKFKPWFLSMMMSIPACAMQDLRGEAAGFDKRLEAIAKTHGIAVAGLDTPDVLTDIFGEMPMEDQLDGLRATLSTAVQSDDMFVTTLDSYFSGRHRELWEVTRIMAEDMDMDDPVGLFEEMEQALLIDRNVKWAPIVARHVRGKNVVLAVGAAHLSGETGMLRMLEKMGYALSPL